MNCKKCGKQVKNNNELCEECSKKLNLTTRNDNSTSKKLDLDLNNMDFSPSEFYSGDFSNEPVVDEPIDRSPEISVKKIQAPSARRMPKPSDVKIFPVGTNLPPEEPTLTLASPKKDNIQEQIHLTSASPSSNTFTEKQNTAVSNQTHSFNSVNTAPAKKSKLFPLIAVLAAFILVIGLGAFYLINNGSKEVNLNNYVTINFKGYEGHGIPIYDIDYLKLDATLSGSSTEVPSEDADILNEVLAKSEYHDFLASIACDFNKKTLLNTGDQITANITYDKKMAQSLNISLVTSPITVIVSDLPSTRELNPFDDIALAFEGISPKGTVSVEVNSKDAVYEALTFTCDKTKNIKNGDKITVTVNYESDNYILDNYGYTLSATSQVFECNGLDSYLTNASNFTDTMLGQLQSAATGMISDYQSELKNDATISNINYAGYYLLTAKKSVEDDMDYNIFYALYSATISSKNNSFETTTVYFPVKFTNMLILADGTPDISKDTTEIVGTTTLTYNSGKKIKGFTNATTLKKQLADTQNGMYSLKVLEIKPEVPRTKMPKITNTPNKPTTKPAPPMITSAPKKTALPPVFDTH
ncbi:MAG: hypothetical protein II838_01280 [Lachnospiraceae bacterium]|nr:hypothetical protein [Lachnospiraceae bacterium]